MFLGFLDFAHPDFLQAPLADRVTPVIVREFVDYLRTNCRDTTVADCLARLYYVVRALAPDHDWQWIYRASRSIARKAVPIRHPQVLSVDLYKVGFSLMERACKKAGASGRLTKSAAILFRDGLLIATLVEAPMRRRAFSSLLLNEHVVKQGSCWSIHVPAKLNKTPHTQDYQLSDRLSECMTLYVEQVRNAFPGAGGHLGLWPYEGRPMTDKMIRRRTMKWTRRALGVGVSPHRFRNAAANFISVSNPEGILVARDLLGHRTFATTEKHYLDGARSRAAGSVLTEILDRTTETTNPTL
ncbi:MAG: site-specific integrase [Mesorhizobium sp.]|uniref:hypothetical protein n=1 Tax=Mesorhizobium sp. TaxID=1871066 RepID=UPI0011FF4F37|nr:hypothetical protein [Mesorhizobium sp.]TIP25750.1 MAG: site-specific integrase [Mesorhizobium sp.]